MYSTQQDRLRWPVPCETPTDHQTQVVESFNLLFDEGVLVRTPTGESTRVFCAVVHYQGDWKWHKDSRQHVILTYPQILQAPAVPCSVLGSCLELLQAPWGIHQNLMDSPRSLQQLLRKAAPPGQAGNEMRNNLNPGLSGLRIMASIPN